MPSSRLTGRWCTVLPEYINYLLTAYFALLGSAAMTKAFTSIAHLLLGEERAKAAAWNQRFRFKLWKKVKEGTVDAVSVEEECARRFMLRHDSTIVTGKEAVVAATFDYVTVGAVILSVFFTAY